MIAGPELNLNSVPAMVNSFTRAPAAVRFFSSRSARCSSLTIECFYGSNLARPPYPKRSAVILLDQALAKQRGQRRIRPVRVFFEDSSFHGLARDLSAADERTRRAFEEIHNGRFFVGHSLKN